MSPKRNNRRVWLMIAILAVVVLGGVGVLFDRYQSSLPMQEPGVILLPRNEWGFGREEVTLGVMEFGTVHWTVVAERLKLGFFSLRVR
jgi:hypothetical protein